MKLDEVIHILTEHNMWRRGKPPYDGLPDGSEPKPKEVGEAIDFAVEELHRLNGLEK
jgi:hypothetical protein